MAGHKTTCLVGKGGGEGGRGERWDTQDIVVALLPGSPQAIPTIFCQMEKQNWKQSAAEMLKWCALVLVKYTPI